MSDYDRRIIHKFNRQGLEVGSAWGMAALGFVDRTQDVICYLLFLLHSK
jgi:hypothetical protein